MKTGDKISDNDPRMQPRVLTITAVEEDRIIANNKYKILKRRIYTDGKPRKSGFTLLPQ